MIHITDRHYYEKEDRHTVKYLAKFVTGMLLVALLATPALASVPCSPSAHTMACCGGAACSKMAMTSGSKTADHSGTKGDPSHCCKLKSHFLVAVTPQKAQERPFSIVVPLENLAAFFAPAVERLDTGLAHIDVRSLRRSQSDLCTFLI